VSSYTIEPAFENNEESSANGIQEKIWVMGTHNLISGITD